GRAFGPHAGADRDLVEIRRHDGEDETEGAEQLATARRRRGENELRRCARLHAVAFDDNARARRKRPALASPAGGRLASRLRREPHAPPRVARRHRRPGRAGRDARARLGYRRPPPLPAPPAAAPPPPPPPRLRLPPT